MRRATLIGLLVLAAAAAVWSLASGAASVLAWQAERSGARASAQDLSAGGSNDQAIRRLLTLAQELEPLNADYSGQLALHLERMALQAPPRGARETALLDEAKRLNITAAGRRPTWPLGFISALRIRFRLGRLDQEFVRLYTRAADLGRSEPAALRALTDLGLVTWPVLGPDGQRQVEALLHHGLRLDPDFILARAIALRQEALVEPLIAADPHLQQRYQALRVTAARQR